MRNRVVIPVALAVGALAALGLSGDRLSAGGPKPTLAITFGPGQVESGSAAAFVLNLQNTGGADAVLGLGDQISVNYRTGPDGADLLPAGEELAADDLPAGTTLQPFGDRGGNRLGILIAVEGTVTIEAGTTLPIVLRGVSGTTGAAPVTISTQISKKSAKAPKSVGAVVLKTPPGSGAPGFFGDGADGPLDVSSDTTLEPLRSYTDVLIRTGVTVTVPSGATIRCTGTFENRGTLVVGPGGRGGGVVLDIPDGDVPFDIEAQADAAAIPWQTGDARSAPGRPAAMRLQAVTGAAGGTGLGNEVFALPLSHYRHGGGGGSGSLGAVGGHGGGLLRVLARGPVRNGGTIRAIGAVPTANRLGLQGFDGRGAGGGGGGIVILASAERVENNVPANTNGPAATGTVDVRGANGGQPDALGGGGGGGGGGLVMFVAPAVGATGVTQLEPGLNQNQLASTPEPIFCGGGGGGACVGNGGGGTGVEANGDIGPVADGDGGFHQAAAPGLGQLVIRELDPRSIWH